MRSPIAGHSCALVLTLCVIASGLFISKNAHAFAAKRDSHYTQPGAKKTWVVTSLGDSIAAGFCGVGCLGMESYVHYFAYHNEGSVAKTLNVNIESRGRAISGYTSGEILKFMDYTSNGNGESAVDPSQVNVPQDLRDADVITMDACGNDYLPARREFIKTCNVAPLRKAVQTCKTNIEKIYAKAQSLAKPTALLRVMNIYYPGMNKDKEGQCNGRSYYDTFLDHAIEGNYHICEIARRRGIPCADAFSVMNTADENREKIAWIPGESLESYKERVTVTYKDLLTDPTEKKRLDGSVVSLMQEDNIHPTDEGHSRIAYAHQELGY